MDRSLHLQETGVLGVLLGHVVEDSNGAHGIANRLSASHVIDLEVGRPGPEDDFRVWCDRSIAQFWVSAIFAKIRTTASILPGSLSGTACSVTNGSKPAASILFSPICPAMHLTSR